ncbi:MAG: hypothetical protein ABSG43_23750 [Solirubrobacteraceae bacterium]
MFHYYWTAYPYHQVVCGDWWDEDPYSPQYNKFVYVPCGVTPAFASWSEALWTETVAYPYFAVIQFNMSPILAGANALGSGIFLHSWVDGRWRNRGVRCATRGSAARDPSLAQAVRAPSHRDRNQQSCLPGPTSVSGGH